MRQMAVESFPASENRRAGGSVPPPGSILPPNIDSVLTQVHRSHNALMNKSFLLLFFKKEALPFESQTNPVPALQKG